MNTLRELMGEFVWLEIKRSTRAAQRYMEASVLVAVKASEGLF